MYKNFEKGRSMIEMLGVLAIIAVLSVGGIAGYSKAMEQFKINKAISEYNYLIFGMIEHSQDLKKLDDNTHLYGILDAIGLIPSSWKDNSGHIKDSLGNTLQIYFRNNKLMIDMFLGGLIRNSDGIQAVGFSYRLCEKIMQNVVQPLHSSLSFAYIYGVSGFFYYGDDYCYGSDRKCLNQMSLTDINKFCYSCPSGHGCALVLGF